MYSKSYRKTYEKLVCKIPKNFDIHHIDENRNNNNIDNLIMLPTDLHKKYHKLSSDIEYYNGVITKILPRTNACIDYNENFKNVLKEFNAIWYECSKWADNKEYKLGNLTNIHNIKFD